MTVKVAPLLGVLFTMTMTVALPVDSVDGTGTKMLVALQLVGVPETPLNVTALDPWGVPKFVPVIVTGDPTAPEAGFRLVIMGAVLPLPLAGLNAATAAPQLALADSVAVATMPPAAPWT